MNSINQAGRIELSGGFSLTRAIDRMRLAIFDGVDETDAMPISSTLRDAMITWLSSSSHRLFG